MYRADEVMFRTGDPATRFFLLKRGIAKYYRVSKTGEEVLLWWLAPDNVFGLGALLAEPVHYIGTAQAVDDCELLVWSRDRIRSLSTIYSLLAQNALQIILHYVALYTDRVVGLASGTAAERLAHVLIQLGGRIGEVRPQGVEVTIKNDDLARLANVSAFTASRQLNLWERQGILQKGRGKVSILSPEGLLAD
jgi:CRP/FNR family transcriptional regulator, nitrogen oxide reductase regulator